MTDFKYCPKCKSKLKNNGNYPHCYSCNITYYKNSKPCIGVLLIKDGKVLLSKRAISPFKGEYDIIGGFLSEGEHPEDGAIREAEEETGNKVKLIDLLGIYMDKYGKAGEYTLNMQYVAKIVGGNMSARDDVSSLHWYPIGKIPIKHGFSHTKDALLDLKKWYIENYGEFR